MWGKLKSTTAATALLLCAPLAQAGYHFEIATTQTAPDAQVNGRLVSPDTDITLGREPLYLSVAGADNRRREVNWFYYHSADEETTPERELWTSLGVSTVLPFQNALDHAQEEAGFYRVIAEFESSSLVFTIRVQALESVEFNRTHAFVNETQKPVRITCDTSQTFDDRILYRFPGTAPGEVRVREPGENNFFPLQNTEHPGSPELEVAWTTDGVKQVQVIYRGKQFTEQIRVYGLVPQDFRLVRNANDSDGDGGRDFEKSSMSEPDPDIKPVTVLVRCGGETQPLHEAIDLLEEMRKRNIRLVISTTDNIRIFSSPTKDDHLAGPDYDGDVETAEHYFSEYEEIDTDVEFLQNLYAEGIAGSPSMSGDQVRLNFTEDDEHVTAIKLLITVAHLRVNISPDLHDLSLDKTLEAYRPLRPTDPINILYNPAVIILQEPNSIDPEKFAIFQLDLAKLKPLGLPENTDWIQWTVESESIPLTPAPGRTLPEPGDNGNAQIHGNPFGKKIQVYGIAPGYITLTVRLKGEPIPYLKFRAWVGQEIEIPYCFKIFHSGNSSSGAIDPRWKNIFKLTRNLSGHTAVANRILRQAGLKIVPYNFLTGGYPVPDNNTSIYRAALSSTNIHPTSSLINVESHFHKLVYPQESGDVLKTPYDVFFKIVNDTGTVSDGLHMNWFDDTDDGYQVSFKKPIGNPVSGNAWITPDVPNTATTMTQAEIETITGGQIQPDFINQCAADGILYYENMPEWVASGGGVYTLPLAPVKNVLNINLLWRLFEVEMKPKLKTKVGGIALVLPSHHLCHEHQASLHLPAETGDTDIVPFGLPVAIFRNPLDYPRETDFRYSGILLSMEDEIKRKEPFSTPPFPHTVTHEILHTLGLCHRNPNADDEMENDGIESAGFVPEDDYEDSDLQTNYMKSVDEPLNNSKNLMTPVENGVDIDLQQAIIARNSRLTEN